MALKDLVLAIPTTFRVPRELRELADLKSDLERLAANLAAYAGVVKRSLAPVPEVRPDPLVATDGAALFDVTIKVAPRTASTVIQITLPQPDPANIGRVCRVQRTGALGLVVMRPVGLDPVGQPALVNGASSMMLSNALMVTSFTFDGVGYYSDNPGNGPVYSGAP